MTYTNRQLREMPQPDLAALIRARKAGDPPLDLTRANLTGTNLTMANLYGADLTRANLYGTNLTMANLTMANLYGADLTRANLYGADLTMANLTGADLTRAKIPPIIAAQLMVVPEEGTFTAWKKLSGGHVAKLQVPEHAQRSTATGRKSRVSEAIVLTIYTLTGAEVNGPIASSYDPSFTYTVGETVTPREPFDENRWNECASGIHVFITRQEAVDYC